MIIKDVLGRVVVVLGIHRRLMRSRTVVVAFHSIVRGPTDGALRCGEKDFERYCRFFSKRLGALPLTDALRYIAEGRDTRCAVVVTFDDGYADNAEVALPILRRYQIPATVFISTAFIDSNHQAHWDRDAGITSRWMTWAQIRELQGAGIDIGCHTVNHADMARLSIDEAREEIEWSCQDIQRRLGRRPLHFAIPYGRWFESISAVSGVALAAGMQSVWLCRGGTRFPTRDYPYGERVPVMPGNYLSPYGWLIDVLRDSRVPQHTHT